MIVDDDANSRAVLRDVLGGEPYTLLEAADGQQALELANKELPDLILLDIMMPGIDGIGVLHKLKEQEKTRAIPVIMVTVFRLDSQVSACLDDGAVDHICKPFSSLVVCSRVRAALRSRSQAETANIAKSQFLANISHEIRTPMTAILGYADLMLEENVGRTTREHVEVIKRNGEHLLGLINDILELSNVEAGKMQIELTGCSPVQVVAEVISLMRVRADSKHLKLKTELAGALPQTVLTDPLRLRQVLVNLVDNAIKFTDQGEVCITARLTDDGGRPRLYFDVTDTGIGMSEEQVQKLFQPFAQGDNSSTRKFGGAGLGLCIGKHLAEALGGDIEVRSEPGKGSTFSMSIDPGPLSDHLRNSPQAPEKTESREYAAT
jgi:signal transduction histidine kinase